MSKLKGAERLKIPFKEIKKATNNFKNEIGKSEYGPVYRGELTLSGVPIVAAVRKLDIYGISGQVHKEFLMEIQMLSVYKHHNIVSLLGFCIEGKDKFLVYEHAEHGSLDKHLSPTKDNCSFTWKQRINICIDAARGLDYLHNHVAKHERVIHRDIKSGNILLDHNWKAMISDFGLRKQGRANENITYIITNACGTQGYCDPEYFKTGILTKESDIYSFGVVLYEVLCGRLCYMHVKSLTKNLAIDPALNDYINSESMNKFMEIASRCLLDDRNKRPIIGVVLQELEEALELLETKEAPELIVTSMTSWSNANMMKMPQQDVLFLPDDVGHSVFSTDVPIKVSSQVNMTAKIKAPIKEFEHLYIQLEAIKSATDNFADESCIGRGGFGKVYRGKIGHKTVALKRFDDELKTGQGDKEYWNEVMMLSLYQHQNIVSLLGYCDDHNEKILMYEYLPNKSLDRYLNSDNLSWVKRLEICIGAARGLLYLHSEGTEETKRRLLHRDIKSSNILLDKDWNAKIGDFGLSQFGPANQVYSFLFSNVAGTPGYCDPIYAQTGQLTKESDVYSFGVVLLEVLCGRLCIVRKNPTHRYLLELAQKSFKENTISEIVFGSIKDEINPESLQVFAKIAEQCVKMAREERPLMAEVVTALETALQYQVS